MGPVDRVPDRDAVWPLVGREEELAFAADALRAGGLVLAGAAGVGKTRVARDAVALVRADVAGVRWATATRAAAAIPFGALAHLLPDEAHGDPTDLLAGLRGAARALSAGSGKRRMIVAIDDAHLLDPGSAALLLQLALTGAAVVLATVRTGAESPDSITALWKDGHVRRLDLQSLSAPDTTRMVQAALDGQVERTTARSLFERSGGNPLYVVELVRGALADGSLTRVHGVWHLPEPGEPPERLAELISVRLGGLGAAPRRLLELVALAEPLELGIALRLESREAARALEDRGVVAIHGSGRRKALRTAHPLYGEVAAERLPGGRRAEHLGRLAEALEEAGGRRSDDLLRAVTWQLDAGAYVTPERLLAAAAQALDRFDHTLAARIARAAIDAGGGAEAALTYGRACSSLGRHPDVELELATLPARELEFVQAQEVLWLRTRALQWGLRDREQADRLLTEAAGWRPGADWRRAVDQTRLDLATDRGRLGEAVELSRALLEGADQDTRAEVTARLAIALALLGHAGEARALGADSIAADRGDPWTIALRVGVRVEIGDDWDGVEEALGRLYGPAAGRGDEAVAAMCELTYAHAGVARGRPRTAARWCAEAALHFALADPRGYGGTVALARLAYAHALLGDSALAASGLDRAAELVRYRPPTWIEDFELSRARAWAAAAVGDMASAQQTLLAAAARMAEVVQRRVVLLHDAVRVGFPASGASERLQALTAGLDAPLLVAMADHVGALARQDAGALARAAERFERMDALLLAAETHAEAAQAHDQLGATAAARAAATRSRALAAQCEGARTPPLSLATLPGAGLTRREREIAMLVAMELANAEIADRLVLSVRTVESHVYKVFAKLGVTSRHELRELLRAEPP